MITATQSSPMRSSALAPMKMKGIGFANIHKYVATKHDEAMWQKVRGSMRAEDRDAVSSAVAVGWYDVYLFGRLLRAVDAVCGKGDLRLMNDIGVFECEQDFNRIFRFFLQVLSPTALMKAEARLWKHFQDSGTYESVATNEGMLTKLTGWAVDEALCNELGGYLNRIVQLTVTSPVRMTHEQCRAKGDNCCAYRFVWK